MLRNKTFASEFCSLISNWFDMREQAPGANLLHESFQEQAPWCVLKFACRDMTCLQLPNQIGLILSSTTHCALTFKMVAEEQLVAMPQSGCFIIQLPRRVLRVYWLGYLPGSVFRERVSGASSLVCTGLNGTLVI